MRTLTETDYAWLAGFIDGDGNVSVFRHTEPHGYRNGKDRPRLLPSLTIVNCDPRLINEVLSIVEVLGAGFHVFEIKKNNPKHATSWQLTTRNTKYIKNILEKVTPYLVGKKEQAELILRFINSRWSETGTGQNRKYSDEEYILSDRISLLNKKGVSKTLTDYTQSPPRGEDIVGSTAKSVEIGRNDLSPQIVE